MYKGVPFIEVRTIVLVDMALHIGRWKVEGGRWKVEGGRWKVYYVLVIIKISISISICYSTRITISVSSSSASIATPSSTARAALHHPAPAAQIHHATTPTSATTHAGAHACMHASSQRLPRETKVAELNNPMTTNEDVLRFHVAMHDPVVV
jgi:hypothetical protein